MVGCAADEKSRQRSEYAAISVYTGCLTSAFSLAMGAVSRSLAIIEIDG